MILWELKSKGQSPLFSENLVDVENCEKLRGVVPIAIFFGEESCKPRVWVLFLFLSLSPFPHLRSAEEAVILNISICLWGQWHLRSSGLTRFEAGEERRVWMEPGCCSIFGDDWKGRCLVLGFFWTLLPLRVRSGDTGETGSFTEWQPARLMVLGWGTSTDVCRFLLSLADFKHKRDGNNPLQPPAPQARD